MEEWERAAETACRMRRGWLEWDDMHQAALLAGWQAVDTFDPDEGPSLFSWCLTKALWAIHDAWRVEHGTRRRRVETVPLEETFPGWEDYLQAELDVYPSDQPTVDDFTRYASDLVQEEMMRCLVAGHTATEIADVLGITISAISQTRLRWRHRAGRAA